ncbi:PH domain-containing protein [Amphibiibacter pelophylacis]|uniref:PH domain-containing protein n=1 Tax=Amphibiibacter pelophylacis TaxID=1799477 RepID=A0ACC6P0G0_9BURK
MSYIDDSLSAGETVVARFGQHWLTWMPVALCVLLAPVTLGLSLIVAGVLALRIRSLEQGLTTRRVILKTGFISRHSEEMRLGSVETVEIRQSLWGRILGYGSIEITGRGTSDLLLRRVADPMAVKRAIESAANSAEAHT